VIEAPLYQLYPLYLLYPLYQVYPLYQLYPLYLLYPSIDAVEGLCVFVAPALRLAACVGLLRFSISDAVENCKPYQNVYPTDIRTNDRLGVRRTPMLAAAWAVILSQQPKIMCMFFYANYH